MRDYLTHLRSLTLALVPMAMQACAGPTGNAVASCNSQPPDNRTSMALVGQPYGAGMSPIPLNSVLFASKEIAQTVAVQSLHAVRTPTKNVQVTARLVSCLDARTIVQMRTSFMREDTAPSGPPSAWQTVYLEPRATALYSELSLSPDVASYLIEVRPER